MYLLHRGGIYCTKGVCTAHMMYLLHIRGIYCAYVVSTAQRKYPLRWYLLHIWGIYCTALHGLSYDDYYYYYYYYYYYCTATPAPTVGSLNYNLGATSAKKTAAVDLVTESQELTLFTSGNSYWSDTSHTITLSVYSGRLRCVDIGVTRTIHTPTAAMH